MSLDFYINYVDEETGAQAEIFERNITHNVSGMWKEAGVYGARYNSSGQKPKEIIEVLRKGLKDMEDSRPKYRKLNPTNGWRDSEGAMIFLRDVITACAKFPNATIGISK